MRRCDRETRMIWQRRSGLAVCSVWLVAAIVFAGSAVAQAPAQSDCAAQSAAVHWTPVRSIDFSSKHNVMIKSEDGTLTPMDVPYYKSELIAPGTWRIESDGDYSYLLEGDNEALAIDTGYGAGNIREYLQTLTKKPVRYVANTHNHFDHTANDAYFDCAYMSKETAEKATIPFASFSGINFPRNYPKVIVSDGYKIELGNREVEVFLIPNHTAGGTAYLDKREKILFSGDEIWRGGISIAATSSVAQYARNMEKLEAHRGDFDRLATGGFGVIDATWVDKYLATAKAIMAGQEGDPVTQGRSGPGGGGPGGPGGAAGGPGGQGGGDPRAAAGASESSQVVYRRRFPRQGDSADPKGQGGPGQGSNQPNGNMRKLTLDGCSITYDIRHIQS